MREAYPVKTGRPALSSLAHAVPRQREHMVALQNHCDRIFAIPNFPVLGVQKTKNNNTIKISEQTKRQHLVAIWDF